MQRLIGKSVAFQFESGFTVEAHYLDATHMRWSARGQSGTEGISVATVSPDILFISWVENSGTTVSHVLDLIRHTVWSFVSYTGAAGREGRADRGTWKFVDSK